MKKLLAITCVLFLALSGIAFAYEENWSISIKGDNGAGSAVGPAFRLGVGTPGETPVNWMNVPADCVLVAGAIPGSTRVYSQVIQAPGPAPKVWYLRFAGMPQASGFQIRMLWYTVSSTLLPPATVNGYPVRFRLRLTDNRGMPGAPANGTEWIIPTPAAHSSSPFYVGPTLPMLRISAMNDNAMLNEAYKLEFHQDVVPEPMSVMALGMGAAAVGFALKRRRK